MHPTLWLMWFGVARLLRPGFPRTITFFWALVAMVGFAIRSEHDSGVTDLVRATGLRHRYYQRLLDHFHATFDLDRLARRWLTIVIQMFQPLRVNGTLLFVADGIKVGKEGRKMPGVKLVHQASSNNSKPDYIMAHSLQQLSLLVTNAFGAVLAIPIITRILESPEFEASSLNKLSKSMSGKNVWIFL